MRPGVGPAVPINEKAGYNKDRKDVIVMAKSFVEVFNDAWKKQGGNPHRDAELERVHQKNMRDPNHAYRDTLPKPNPWKTGPIL